MKTVIVGKDELFDQRDVCFASVSSQLQYILHRISSLRIDQNDFNEILTSQDLITYICILSIRCNQELGSCCGGLNIHCSSVSLSYGNTGQKLHCFS